MNNENILDQTFLSLLNKEIKKHLRQYIQSEHKTHKPKQISFFKQIVKDHQKIRINHHSLDSQQFSDHQYTHRPNIPKLSVITLANKSKTQQTQRSEIISNRTEIILQSQQTQRNNKYEEIQDKLLKCKQNLKLQSNRLKILQISIEQNQQQLIQLQDEQNILIKGIQQFQDLKNVEQTIYKWNLINNQNYRLKQQLLEFIIYLDQRYPKSNLAQFFDEFKNELKDILIQDEFKSQQYIKYK